MLRLKMTRKQVVSLIYAWPQSIGTDWLEMDTEIARLNGLCTSKDEAISRLRAEVAMLLAGADADAYVITELKRLASDKQEEGELNGRSQ